MSTTAPEGRNEVRLSPAGGHSPDASQQGQPGVVGPSPARFRPARVRSKRSLVIAFVAGFVVASIIFAVLATSRDGAPYKARQFYQRIQLGMTRTKVQRLMLPSKAMYSTVESTDIMILHERFMIAVTYGPAPPNTAPPSTVWGQPPDDWVVKQKLYVDHLRRGWLESVTTSLKLRPDRVTSDRVRDD
jgi:hypothetical protein